ncbi:hypothetical protein HUJ05_003054 [Dendroctonus ponderosae]|nr:hypothetical protein HUJ05_003054 [Dendroctonus ponderosae]
MYANVMARVRGQNNQCPPEKKAIFIKNSGELFPCHYRYFINNTNTPNLKTSTPQTRTQLKLQLMRDHAILEQQRQTAERQRQQELKQSQRPSPAPVKVPLHTLAVDVPPQVLEVQTKLENPTRYHVMQKQKSQVKQYLSESFQSPCHPAFLTDYQRKMTVNQTNSAPPGVQAQNMPLQNSMSTNLASSQTQSYQSQVSPNYDIPSLSPALSSGATSASEKNKSNLHSMPGPLIDIAVSNLLSKQFYIEKSKHDNVASLVDTSFWIKIIELSIMGNAYSKHKSNNC